MGFQQGGDVLLPYGHQVHAHKPPASLPLLRPVLHPGGELEDAGHPRARLQGPRASVRRVSRAARGRGPRVRLQGGEPHAGQGGRGAAAGPPRPRGLGGLRPPVRLRRGHRRLHPPRRLLTPGGAAPQGQGLCGAGGRRQARGQYGLLRGLPRAPGQGGPARGQGRGQAPRQLKGLRGGEGAGGACRGSPHGRRGTAPGRGGRGRRRSAHRRGARGRLPRRPPGVGRRGAHPPLLRGRQDRQGGCQVGRGLPPRPVPRVREHRRAGGSRHSPCRPRRGRRGRPDPGRRVRGTPAARGPAAVPHPVHPRGRARPGARAGAQLAVRDGARGCRGRGAAVQLCRPGCEQRGHGGGPRRCDPAPPLPGRRRGLGHDAGPVGGARRQRHPGAHAAHVRVGPRGARRGHEGRVRVQRQRLAVHGRAPGIRGRCPALRVPALPGRPDGAPGRVHHRADVLVVGARAEHRGQRLPRAPAAAADAPVGGRAPGGGARLLKPRAVGRHQLHAAHRPLGVQAPRGPDAAGGRRDAVTGGLRHCGHRRGRARAGDALHPGCAAPARGPARRGPRARRRGGAGRCALRLGRALPRHPRGVGRGAAPRPPALAPVTRRDAVCALRGGQPEFRRGGGGFPRRGGRAPQARRAPLRG
mmetsp:Transcript_1615/g.4717  ORF Transcript_1615/g.4717 Transcript_1615/m.4717 type:complete len:641 (-) Transcript_1615:969-2891(-)